MDAGFRYGDIRELMQTVVCTLEEAGHSLEAQAMASLTHIVGARLEPLDVADQGSVTYLLECIAHHHALVRYIDTKGLEASRA